MKHKKGIRLIFTGLLLVAAAFLLVGYNIYDGNRALRSSVSVLEELDDILEEEDNVSKTDGESTEFEVPDYILNPEMDMPVRAIDGQDYIGVLSIPSCNLELPIISEWSYFALKTAPCRYSGSAYTDNLIIAGHNYRSHFGALSHLGEGEQVVFTDMDGNVFTYVVAVRETLDSTAVEDMEGGDWDLTLFTCTLGGQSRMTIRCVKEEGSFENQ